MIFIDTGTFLARYLERDQHYKEAAPVPVWLRLNRDKPKLYTSAFVLDETLTLLACRSSYAFAASKGRTIFASDAFTVLRSSAKDELASLELFEKYADQKISFTDCVSFVLMRKLELREVFTFDQHFRYAGFEVVPA